jgi:hypothetical protein
LVFIAASFIYRREINERARQIENANSFYGLRCTKSRIKITVDVAPVAGSGVAGSISGEGKTYLVARRYQVGLVVICVEELKNLRSFESSDDLQTLAAQIENKVAIVDCLKKLLVGAYKKMVSRYLLL